MGDRYNGDGREPCLLIHRGTATVFTSGSGEGSEEFDGEGSIGVVGITFGRWGVKWQQR